MTRLAIFVLLASVGAISYSEVRHIDIDVRHTYMHITYLTSKNNKLHCHKFCMRVLFIFIFLARSDTKIVSAKIQTS